MERVETKGYISVVTFCLQIQHLHCTVAVAHEYHIAVTVILQYFSIVYGHLSTFYHIILFKKYFNYYSKLELK